MTKDVEHTDNPDTVTISRCDDHLYAALLAMVDERVTVRFALKRMLEFYGLQSVANFDRDYTLEHMALLSQAINDGRCDVDRDQRPELN
ncbi:MAG: hypothetical protein RIA09_21175 [Hoeflea sp.]|uniref:hypothetical protein n=1 Tax=Hoeflea sp. TaxID=1940281 RepID=UPI0032EC4FE3